jgi:hypothetical protein
MPEPGMEMVAYASQYAPKEENATRWQRNFYQYIVKNKEADHKESKKSEKPFWPLRNGGGGGTSKKHDVRSTEAP